MSRSRPQAFDAFLLLFKVRIHLAEVRLHGSLLGLLLLFGDDGHLGSVCVSLEAVDQRALGLAVLLQDVELSLEHSDGRGELVDLGLHLFARLRRAGGGEITLQAAHLGFQVASFRQEPGNVGADPSQRLQLFELGLNLGHFGGSFLGGRGDLLEFGLFGIQRLAQFRHLGAADGLELRIFGKGDLAFGAPLCPAIDVGLERLLLFGCVARAEGGGDMLLDSFVLARSDAAIAGKAVTLALCFAQDTSQEGIERVDRCILVLGGCDLFCADLDRFLGAVKIGRQDGSDGLLQLVRRRFLALELFASERNGRFDLLELSVLFDVLRLDFGSLLLEL